MATIVNPLDRNVEEDIQISSSRYTNNDNMTTQGLQTLNDGPFNLKHLNVSYFGYTINHQLCCHLDNFHF